jgi:hypothetical protein
LESLPFEILREIVSARIEDVLDMDAFEAEVEKEQEDQDELSERRSSLTDLIAGGLDDLEDEQDD